MCVLQGAIAAVERRHADELREELQDTRDLCSFYQQENEELNMVSMLYQRQLEQVKQHMAAAKPVHGETWLFNGRRVMPDVLTTDSRALAKAHPAA